MKTYLAMATILLLSLPAQGYSQDKVPVTDFIRFQPHHGIDYSLASQYGAEDVADLARILKNRDEVQYWSAAVWVLGVIASENAESVLIEFLEKGGEGAVVDPPVLQALMLVPPALGFRAQDPQTRAFSYLRDSIDPEKSPAQAFGWSFKGWEPGTRELVIAKLSINGLGLAGNEEAIDILDTLDQNRDEKLWQFIAPNVQEARKLSRDIMDRGRASVMRTEIQERGEKKP